jgi:hypothetical protein
MNDVSKDGAKSKIPLLKEYKVDQLVAGIASGAASTAILHPLDLVKIQFQGRMRLFPFPSFLNAVL